MGHATSMLVYQQQLQRGDRNRGRPFSLTDFAMNEKKTDLQE